MEKNVKINFDREPMFTAPDVEDIREEVIEETETRFTLSWKEKSILLMIFAIAISILFWISSNSKPEEPVKKSAILILTETNQSFMGQIGKLSEQKKDLVIQRNILNKQIDDKDFAISQYALHIDENASKISSLTTNSK